MTEAVSRKKVLAARRIVVKLGSAILTAGDETLNRQGINGWCRQIAQLRERGYEIVIVSSGAVAVGVGKLGWQQRPASIHKLQAAAAVGQMGLMQYYESQFASHDITTAMVLLTQEDIANRGRYLNARAALTTLLKMGVVPTINENDSVATHEIRFGDNDTLAALVTNLLGADLLIILTDQAGLHREDPRKNSNAPLVSYADANDLSLDAMVSATSGGLGRGGMVSKLAAARLAARSGAQTFITSGLVAEVLTKTCEGTAPGTLLSTDIEPMLARKRWIADQLSPRGEIVLDEGAVAAITGRGVSLLPVGAVAVHGSFSRGDVVACVNAQDKVIAQGLCNYTAEEIELLLGVSSELIESRLGYVDEPELIHRDNLVLL